MRRRGPDVRGGIRGWLEERLGRLLARPRLGQAGERAAAKHLRSQGLRILAFNVREGHGEIDLVALEKSTLVFVEVKSRTAGVREEMTGLEKLNRPKLRALRRACGRYTRKLRFEIQGYRLDAVTVEFEETGRRRKVRDVRWYPGVASLDES